MIQELPGDWASALNALGLETAQTAEPSGESQLWYQVTMRFMTRGFLIAYLRPEHEQLKLRIECALPHPEKQPIFSAALVRQLEQQGASHATLTHPGPPMVVSAQLPQTLDDLQIKAIGALLLKIGDYIHQAEADAHTPMPFAAEAPIAPVPTQAPSAAQEEAPKRVSAFEAIGAGAPAPAATTAPAAPAAPPRGGAFESIGDGGPAPAPPHTSAAKTVKLERFELSPQTAALTLWLKLDVALERHERTTLEQGLSKHLRIRFDVDVKVEYSSREDELRFILEPIIDRDETALRRTAQDISRLFDRLIQFGTMGMDLFGALDLRQSTRNHEFTERDTLVDVPSKRLHVSEAEQDRRVISQAPASPAPAAPPAEQGVVLSFSADTTTSVEPSASSHNDRGALKPGNFSDPRLKRADSTAPLVDVILRHPGFSDKRIGQVLNILLSIEHSKALQLIEAAPCVIAWGVSRERALTFKNVIEGAGGKALLVEPGTFEA